MSVACIWVVDDDPSVGRALRRMMLSLDCDCLLFTSGDDMLGQIGSGTPTFVLIDFHMPRKSGIETVREMRARGIEVATVMMTGVEREDTREICLSAGAFELLVKPIDAETITGLLGRTGRQRKKE